MKIRRWNRTEYEPNTISSFFRLFDRYLKDNGHPWSIVFDHLNQVKQSLFINIIIIFTKYRIKTSFNGWSCNIAWIITLPPIELYIYVYVLYCMLVYSCMFQLCLYSVFASYLNIHCLYLLEVFLLLRMKKLEIMKKTIFNKIWTFWLVCFSTCIYQGNERIMEHQSNYFS